MTTVASGAVPRISKARRNGRFLGLIALGIAATPSVRAIRMTRPLLPLEAMQSLNPLARARSIHCLASAGISSVSHARSVLSKSMMSARKPRSQRLSRSMSSTLPTHSSGQNKSINRVSSRPSRVPSLYHRGSLARLGRHFPLQLVQRSLFDAGDVAPGDPKRLGDLPLGFPDAAPKPIPELQHLLLPAAEPRDPLVHLLLF